MQSIIKHRREPQEFAEERKHVVRQHAAEVQELSDIIAAVEVRQHSQCTAASHHEP